MAVCTKAPVLLSILLRCSEQPSPAHLAEIFASLHTPLEACPQHANTTDNAVLVMAVGTTADQVGWVQAKLSCKLAAPRSSHGQHG